MDQPLVSCILATKDRQPFLRQAIRYFLRQTYRAKELIIIDDGAAAVSDLVPDHPDLRYIRLDQPANLGHKLNLGIAAARGNLIQKLDDDDYYHPDFLATTTGALLKHHAPGAIAGCDCFLVLVAATGELKYSGAGWCAGGTLCFYRQLWEQKPFRDLPRAVDWWFLQDHKPQRIKIQQPELYILVRHTTGHLWTTLGKTDVTTYFSRRPDYAKPLAACIPAEDLPFYERLRVTS